MKKEKLLLFTLAAIQFTHIMDFMIMMPLGDILMKEFGIGPSEFSVIVSAYPFLATVSSLASALFIDRFDRKHAILLAYVGFVVGTLCCAWAPTYFLLVGARALTGIFGGILSALILAIIGDVIPNHRRASAMGWVMAAFSAAAIAGVPFGLYLADKISWHAPFITVAILGGAIVFLIIFALPSMRGHMEILTEDHPKPTPFKDIWKILTNANQMSGLLFMVLLVLGQFTIIPFITPYLIRNVGFVQGQIPFVYLVGGLLTLFSSPLVGKLSDKFGRGNVFTVMTIGSVIPLIALTHLGPQEHIYLPLIATSLLFIFVSGRMIPANTMLTSAVKSQQRGSYMSLNSSTRQLATGLASILGGLIVVESLNETTGEPGGPLLNYNIVGYIAVGFSIIAIFLGRRLKMVEEDTPTIQPSEEE